jgi:hypothetical protein
MLPFVVVLLPPPLPSSFFFRDEELGWMDDETDDRTNGWKG